MNSDQTEQPLQSFLQRELRGGSDRKLFAEENEDSEQIPEVVAESFHFPWRFKLYAEQSTDSPSVTDGSADR